MIIKEDKQSQMRINTCSDDKKLFLGIYTKEIQVDIFLHKNNIEKLYKYLTWWLGKDVED